MSVCVCAHCVYVCVCMYVCVCVWRLTIQELRGRAVEGDARCRSGLDGDSASFWEPPRSPLWPVWIGASPEQRVYLILSFASDQRVERPWLSVSLKDCSPPNETLPPLWCSPRSPVSQWAPLCSAGRGIIGTGSSDCPGIRFGFFFFYASVFQS